MSGAHRQLRGRAGRWWADGPFSRPGARVRYTTVGVVVAILVSLPALIGAIPVSVKDASVTTLLTRIRASGDVPYTGLASSSGQLAVPDLGTGADALNLLSTTNRLQVWWAGPVRYRVDRQTAVAETDVYRQPDGVWTWDSDLRHAEHAVATPLVPLPGPQDALPANLARRLLEQVPAGAVSTLDSRRIAGRAALGLSWHPKDKRSLIGEVRLWVDPATGVALAVDIFPVGSSHRAFSTAFLDIAFTPPDAQALRFDPSGDPTATVINSEPGGPDNNRPRYRLPATIGGLPERSPPAPLVATYGTAADLVAVVALDAQSGQEIRQQIDSPSRPPITGAFGEASLISNPLLTGLVFVSGDHGYLLLGTVTRAQLEVMAADLERHPARDYTGPAIGRRPGT